MLEGGKGIIGHGKEGKILALLENGNKPKKYGHASQNMKYMNHLN